MAVEDEFAMVEDLLGFFIKIGRIRWGDFLERDSHGKPLGGGSGVGNHGMLCLGRDNGDIAAVQDMFPPTGIADAKLPFETGEKLCIRVRMQLLPQKIFVLRRMRRSALKENLQLQILRV